MDRIVCVPQLPLYPRYLPSTRQSTISKVVMTQQNSRFRYSCRRSVAIKIPLLLLLAVFLVCSTTVNTVNALIEPNLSNRCTRSTRLSQQEDFLGSVLVPDRSSSPASNRRATVIFAANDNNNTPKKQGRAQGVYVRPSGAIEKGSGFFVPGLEGPKVRLVIGLVLLGATVINHFLLLGSFGSAPKIDGSEAVESSFLNFSETTAVVYSILILFQSAIEYAKETLPEAYGEATSKGKTKGNTKPLIDNNTEVLEQKWSSISESANESSSYRSRVQWAAASFLSMTPTTQIMLLTAEEGIQYRLGTFSKTANDSSGVSAALEELSKSKGGRIALPLTHPAVTSLLGTAPISSDDDEASSKLRTVILQRITDDSCWMVSSDQLLAGYTGGDLKWLGNLAGYVVATE